MFLCLWSVRCHRCKKKKKKKKNLQLLQQGKIYTFTIFFHFTPLLFSSFPQNDCLHSVKLISRNVKWIGQMYS